MTSRQIRNQFLEYFKQNGHVIVPSAPIVVKNDPTLLFINAGMNPFKDIFLGNAPIQQSRIADTQKCLRVSGKHNDLEEVGVDTYHHTFFEMLGNWSFGDYFKADAIRMAWTLLTEVYQLPKDRLYVTIFEGDASENLSRDTDSEAIWKQYIAPERILLGSKKDNFWEMGDVGPCGPCTEIHYDSRPDEARASIDGSTLVNQDDPNVIEIWNIVFMEFNRKADRSLEKLPQKHVDTGMGFERLVRVIQGKTSNYDTDLFMPLIEQIAQLCGKSYSYSDSKSDIAFRVIADHIRAISFTIADGQLPSSNGAGYVIRRILRRAVRYGYSYLGFDQPFLYQLVPTLASQFDDVFAELKAQQAYVQQVIKEEELSFLATLSKGIKLFESFAEKSKTELSGDDAFMLYDTYGFPIDLTMLMASEAGLKVDLSGFEQALQVQKNRSKQATKVETEDWVVLHPELDGQATVFCGYESNTSSSVIVKYRLVTAKNQQFYQLVLNQTPFYAESGGQVGDSGVLIGPNGTVDIFNTVKENDTIIHLAKDLDTANLSSVYQAKIDHKRRSAITKNHSATHLLQAALRSILGTHVEQRGSMVNEHLLRFDFAHFAKTTPEELSKIEQLVNEKIAAHIPLLEERDIPLDEAKARGVMALFGEKYGERVRIITFDPNFSQELCGGTHVPNTSEIINFKIISESSIASGVRRIEAITAHQVVNYLSKKALELDQISSALKNPTKTYDAVMSLISENSKNRKLITQYEQYIVESEVDKILKQSEICIQSHTLTASMLKAAGSRLRQLRSAELKIAILISDESGYKLGIALSDDNISKGLSAGTIAKNLSASLGGGGGGQPGFAVISIPQSVSIEQIKAEVHAQLS